MRILITRILDYENLHIVLMACLVVICIIALCAMIYMRSNEVNTGLTFVVRYDKTNMQNGDSHCHSCSVAQVRKQTK